MIVTGAFFAEAAATVDNKLHVWEEGVLENLFVGPDRFARITPVVLLQRGTDDGDGTIELTFIPPQEHSDEPLKIPLQLPEGAQGGQVAHAWYPIGIGWPLIGRYACLVATGGTTISLPLNVQPIPEPN